MDAAVVALTVVLVVITAYYAWQTRLTVKEMRESRTAADATRRRDKSEAAARRALESTRTLQHVMRRRGPAALDRDEIWQHSQRLDAAAPLSEDPNVSECVHTCGLVAFTASWPDDELAREPVGSPAMARLRLQLVVNATRFVLEDYLRERDYEPTRWEGLPPRSGAQAWLLNSDPQSTGEGV